MINKSHLENFGDGSKSDHQMGTVPKEGTRDPFAGASMPSWPIHPLCRTRRALPLELGPCLATVVTQARNGQQCNCSEILEDSHVIPLCQFQSIIYLIYFIVPSACIFMTCFSLYFLVDDAFAHHMGTLYDPLCHSALVSKVRRSCKEFYRVRHNICRSPLSRSFPNCSGLVQTWVIFCLCFASLWYANAPDIIRP